MPIDSTEDDELTAGVSKIDITPDFDRSLLGYVRPDIRSVGVAQRLYAHALVIANDDTKLAIVSADIGFGYDKDQLLSRLNSEDINRNNLLFAGTHTHSAPHLDPWMISQIAKAIEKANDNQVPVEVGWASTTVDNVNQNRSVEAHLANHGKEISPGDGTPQMDPAGSEHPRDTTLRTLRIDERSGDPLAVLCHFAVHPTTYTPHNRLYSADMIGATRNHFRNSISTDSNPIVLFLNGTQGDLITTYDDYNHFALANRLGKRLSDGLTAAWQSISSLHSNIELDSRSTLTEYTGQEIESGKTLSSRSLFGLPFLGGAKNGPSFFYYLGLEGMKLPRWLSGKVHGRKIISAPAPWDTEVEIQQIRIADRMIFTVPGEPSVQMGRRVIDAVQEEINNKINDSMIVGLANGYHGYFTTPEEYDRQHYEGGHTVFGKHTEALVRLTHVDMISEESLRSDTDEDTDSELEPVITPVGQNHDAEIVAQPPQSAERFDVIEIQWNGAADGSDRPIGKAFIRLELETNAGWSEVATDLDPGFIWFIRGGNTRARFDIPGDFTKGTYRFRVTGSGYELTTKPFRIKPSSKLKILGSKLARIEHSQQILFTIQNPAPDPDLHLRPRKRKPSGGQLKFAIDGEPRTVDLDGSNDKLTAACSSVSSGDELLIPADGFVDPHGNTSGQRITLIVGETKETKWPDDMQTGGGLPPGPFGLGIPTVP